MSFPSVPKIATPDVVRRHAEGINRATQKTKAMSFDGATVKLTSDLNLDTGKVLKIAGTQVVGPRQTGWAADTGTAEKTAHATYTAPTISNPPTQAEVQAIANALQDVTRAMKALKDERLAAGSIGA